ncbi:hypothetical protein CP532_0895 [Ophiocordyceps camponoti-leonardi (nom. inval.)]|nr:hypothetical protein CP532_0895 [Ophiocordyceps camponoti-leonardi (nom. inval.)]
MSDQPTSWLRLAAEMGRKRKLGDIAMDLLLFAGVMTAGLYIAQNFLHPILSNIADPDKEKHEQARRQAKAHLERLNRPRNVENGVRDDERAQQAGSNTEDLVLNEYESMVALEMVASQDIHVGFDDIGGLDMIIEELKESVIYPLTLPHLYSHSASLLSAPSGVLLFGPPGCGKTMLAKAVARESGASFINLHISTITEKWYGDSNKIVRAVFSLARKMQPSIIFIDEIDAVLGRRRSGEHEASGMVKAEFMTLWDGLTSANSSGRPAQIVVLGATNRIHDIDDAILRRMPKKFPVPLPGQAQRRKILELLLQETKRDARDFDLDYVSQVTAGMSGSDIKEACREAAMAPVREYLKTYANDRRHMATANPSEFRGIRTSDFAGRISRQVPVEDKGNSTEAGYEKFFDVKFCPYQPLNCDAVFAAVSKKHVVLCRLRHGSEDANPCEIMSVIRDDDHEASSCCCTWTRDPVSGSPYLCIGGVDAKVKIYDVCNLNLVEDVNDLATSPVDSSIIASASDDTSIRIWSIDPVHRKQPCLCILAGEGHSWNLLTLAFHNNGRYLLSGGHDQVINLWTIPDLPTSPVTTPLQIHYPHFSTSAIHSGIVDCVAFYGDQILSRACHDNVIVLWRIEGFSSDNPPLPQSAAPTPQIVVPSNEDPDRLTRSAFVPTISSICPAQYTRLLEFHTPSCGPQFFMRFKLHHVPGQNPVLAFCNAAGNIFFWDLNRLPRYRNVMQATRHLHSDAGKPGQLPTWLKPVIPRPRGESSGRVRVSGSDIDSTTSGQVESVESSPETLASWASKYSIEDPQEPLRAHKTESSSTNFVGRQAAWSPSGEWCVVVGSSNTTLILQRQVN